jgi:hypothetical protein
LVPIFDAKPRSWDAYLAAIGVSGALMASAFVLFVILVGVVTFNTWPHTGGLLGGGGDVALQEPASPAPALSSGPDLVRLLGGAGASSGPRGGVNPGGLDGIGGNDLGSGGSGGSPGGFRGPSGGSDGQPQGAQQPPSDNRTRNVVSQTLSGAGNTVQSDTDSLGNALGGTSNPGLGGVLGGIGRTLNNDLQSLAGNH